MKNVLIGLFLVLFFSCKESGVQLGKPSTFVRYYNGGLPDNAQAIIETSDKGFLILANSQKCATCANTRIKLIKTDAYGNQTWQKLFPDPSLDSTPDSVNYSAYGLTPIPDGSGADAGYLLVGEHINTDPNTNTSTSGLLMIQVGKDGTQQKSTTKKYTSIGVQVQGAAVTYSAKSGNFFVLGKALTGGTDMFLAEVDGSTLNLDLKWSRTFGASTTELANRVFLYGDSIYWGGTRNSSPTEIRWIKTQINTVAESDKPYPSGIATTPPPSNTIISFSCNDICRFGFGYGFTGGYSISAGQYNRTYFFRMDGNGNMTDSASYALKYSQAYPSGNSITSTLDGGFLILATEATDAQASDTNYRLIKIDSHGVVQWSSEYGGRFIDIGSKVLQASDGGYIVLGTTTLANVPSVFLMKTDSQGKIE